MLDGEEMSIGKELLKSDAMRDKFNLFQAFETNQFCTKKEMVQKAEMLLSIESVNNFEDRHSTGKDDICDGK